MQRDCTGTPGYMQLGNSPECLYADMQPARKPTAKWEPLENSKMGGFSWLSPNLIYLNDFRLTLPRMFGYQDKVAHINKLSFQTQPLTECGKVSI